MDDPHNQEEHSNIADSRWCTDKILLVSRYDVCYARNRVARARCRKTPEKLLMGVKSSVRHLQIFGSKVWALAPDKMRKALNAKARWGLLLQCRSY